MKSVRLFSILLLAGAMLVSCSSKNTGGKTQDSTNLKGEISLSGAFALYPLAVEWAGEFQQMHPGVKIDISAGGAGKGITDALSGMVDLGMVSRELYQEEIDKGAVGIGGDGFCGNTGALQGQDHRLCVPPEHEGEGRGSVRHCIRTVKYYKA